MTNEPRTPLSGEQPPYGIPPQQPPYGGQQPQNLPPPQGQQQPPYGQQQPPYFPPPQPGYQQGQQPPGGHAGPGFQYPWQQTAGQPPRPPKKSHRTRNVILGIVAAFVLIIVIVAVASSGNQSNNNSANSAATNPPAAGNNAPAATSPAAPPSSAAPQYTVSQQQAIDSAQSYLQTEPGFSYQGLIGQLDSSAGEGFSVADATFAVNHIAPASDTAFWDAQAVDSAKSYMQTEPGWSCSGLVQQLDSQAGEQFTQAQAEYAAKAVGLGSC